MTKIIVLFVVACASVGPIKSANASAALQSFSVTSSQTGGVFTSVGSLNTPDAGHTTWLVTINVSLLSSLPSSVVLNFPDRAAATLTRDRSEQRGSGAFLWTGRGNGCSALFSAAPFNFRGVISCINAAYAVEVSGTGVLQLIRSNPPLGASSSSWEPPPPAFPSLTPATGAAPAAPSQAPDTAIEILVLYNETVRQAIDGSGNVNVSKTVKFMHDAVDTTQQALSNSVPIGQPPLAQVVFVGAQEVTRAEDGDITADLQYMTFDPEPAAFRNFYGADVVIYVTESGGGNYLGVSNEPYFNASFPAPGPAFAPYASSVVQRDRAINDISTTAPQYQQPYVFPHEFAHQLGANHDNSPTDNLNTTPLTNYAFGRWAGRPASEGGGNRTIMSYLVYPNCGAPCTRILNYSNPSVQVDWFMTGTSAANNALVIQTYANTTAQYHASVTRVFANGFESRYQVP